ncbi:MAG: RDD family protein [Halioglobus sp.]
MNDSNPINAPLLPRRLAALVYDTLLVLPIIMATVALSMGLRTLIFGGAEGDIHQAEMHPQIVQFIALIAVTGFFSWFWIRSGQTLGMQAWRIKLVSSNGGPVTALQSVRRCLAATLSALCLGLGYWWCLFDPKRRYWHDYLSGTELVLLPKPESGKAKHNKK